MMKKHIVVFFACCVVLALIFIQLKDPYAIEKSNSLQGMSWSHWFGTDYLGRDLFSRTFYGSFYSLLLAICSLFGVVLVSLILGGISGLVGGLVDSSITTIADIMISIPSLILTLVFTGFFSNSIFTVMAALIISWSGKYIRYIRNLVLNIRKEEFIILAPLRGSYGKHTLFYHIIPNIFAELLSLFLTDIGKIILSISGLSFLGIGVQPPTPELGTILFDGKAYFFVAPWIFIFPGIILSAIVLITQFISSKIRKRWGIAYD
ncbi:ABC transporter permease [Brevibacillus laterosporus]|uniref:ABC transporter permease n=2 Tax=Brevibacillus TaxID=55080 RepID=UPI00215C3230|nr:ABC transporter permease [Brevibacillus laterosporus]MCR8997180.1 ABC transporter permease [Brevibacillus laterosporus]